MENEFEKYIPNFIQIRSVGAELFDAGERTARQTDRQTEMTKLIHEFRNFAKAAWKNDCGVACLNYLKIKSSPCSRGNFSDTTVMRAAWSHFHRGCHILIFAPKEKAATDTWATVSMNFTSNLSNNQLRSIEHLGLIKLRKLSLTGVIL